MAEKINFRVFWHEAGIKALVLAAICIAYFLIEATLSGVGTTWAGLLKTALQVLKIYACIVLLRRFMYDFKQAYPKAQRVDLRKYGYMVGLLSALVISAAMMAYYQWHPELISQAMDAAVSALPQMDRNTIEAMEMMENNFPQIIFFSNLVYCTLCGVVFSSIIASRLISSNPFEESEEE